MTRRKIGIALITLLALAGLTYYQLSPVRLLDARSAEPPIDAEEDIVVVTYNVNFGVGDPSSARYPETIAALARQEADVLLLQETTPFWEEVIGEALRETYPHQRWRDPTLPYAASGAAILSRFPLSPLDVSPSPVDWFACISAVATTPRGPLRLVNVHLEPAATKPALFYVAFHHHLEIDAHVDAFDLNPHDVPTIIAGDFNEERAGATETLTDRGFDDPVRRFATGKVTWRWPPLALQLDHVFVSDHFEALNATVEEEGASDHFPVRVGLRYSLEGLSAPPSK